MVTAGIVKQNASERERSLVERIISTMQLDRVKNRVRVHVYRGEDDWVIKKERGGRAYRRSESKSEAIAIARVYAQNQKAEAVIIHDEQGQIEGWERL
jgi:hypothetical protein